MKKVTITIRELFFYLFFAVMFGMRMWGIYESKPLYGPLLVLGFVLWGISMLMNEHTLFEYFLCGVLMTVAGLVYLNTGEKGLLMYFALMLGMKGIDTKRLFKVGLIAGMSGMITLTCLSAFGVIEDVAYIQERSIVGKVFRRSLGYPHPNTLSTSFTILAMMVMYVIGHKDKVKVWKASVLLFVSALYLYLYSGSRTGIAITTGYLLVNLFYSYRSRLCLLEKVFVALVMPVLWTISIVAPGVLSDEILMRIVERDPTFAARWTVGNYYMKYNGITPFGCRLNNPKPEIDGIDLSQLYLFLQLGLVSFVIVSLLWIAILYDQVRNNRLSEGVITISLLFMGITDPFLYNIGFKNLAFAFMGTWLFGVMDRNCEKLPVICRKSYRLISAGEKAIEVPYISRNEAPKATIKKAAVFAFGIGVLAALSFSVYIKTPEPKYILADRYPGERENPENCTGMTYSEAEISAFKEEGNLVLNYTDEDERMYLYYTDRENAVENGFYASKAGIMENFRRSVSIFFWGAWIIGLVIRIVPAGLTTMNGKRIR